MADWDDSIDILQNGTQSQRENANCWMRNYLMQCVYCPPCPGRDPFHD